MTNLAEQRYTAVHLLRAGHSVSEVAKQLQRHPNWVRKWYKRYQNEGWSGLQERSRAPKQPGNKISPDIQRAICQARSEVEAEAARGTGLKYIGAIAVRTKMKQKKIKPLPSKATIERVLRANEMTRPKAKAAAVKISYPHVQATAPHQLCQVDIVPHYLPGGAKVACFNAIDVVSRYPTGQASARRRARDAAEFMVHLWQTIGIAHYTQVDNEACFSGGFTHPYVLGTVVRLALLIGTELVFSPHYHPESNGTVERFHQEYDRHVWQDTYLADQAAVQTQADHFFPLYRHSPHHSALAERTPHQCHTEAGLTLLSPAFELPDTKLPLYEGRLHFMRRVQAEGTVSVLNETWPVPDPDQHQAVWVTLEVQASGLTLSIFDAAPDAAQRTCLAAYPFPVSETVLPRPTLPLIHTWPLTQPQPAPTPPTISTPQPASTPQISEFLAASQQLWFFSMTVPAHLVRQFSHTMY
jgi:transposase